MKARCGTTITFWLFFLLHIASAAAPQEFSAWAEDYIRGRNQQALSQGLALARARSAALGDFIRTNPAAALAVALPARIREQMPAEIQPFLERHVSGWADLSVIASLPPRGEPTPPGISRRVELGDETFEAHVYGRRRFQTTKSRLWIHGIVLGREMVLHESPLRKSDNVERAASCVMCSKSPSVESAEFAGKSYSFCSTEHGQQFQMHLEDSENAPGPQVNYDTSHLTEPAAIEAFNTWTMGLKKALLMRVDFSDLPGEPIGWTGLYYHQTNLTETLARNLVDSIANNFYQECSYGQTALTGTITPVLRMPYPGSYYATNSAAGTLMTHAKNAAQAAGYVVTNYDRIAVAFGWLGRSRYPNSGLTFAGRAQVGGPHLWLNGYFDHRVMTHELGHTYGLYHANRWETTDGTATGVGQSIEYGDMFDAMGIEGGDTRYEFNPLYKRHLDWIAPLGVARITNSGTYRVFRFDHPSATGTLALEIPTTNWVFYVAYRQKFTNNPSLMNGAYVFWGPWDSFLLDMTPDSRAPHSDWLDCGLQVGQTMIDNQRGVLLSTVARGGTEPNQFLDVYVRLDAFPPRITQQPQNLDAVEGGSAVFTVAAQTTETLQLQWLFNGIALPGQTNSTFALSPVQSNHEGNYHVIVSNMFGSVTSSIARLTVTSPLGLAVENARLLWRTGGNAAWKLQSAVTHDGVDAAQSGAIGANQESWLETTVIGSGLLVFGGKSPPPATPIRWSSPPPDRVPRSAETNHGASGA